MITPSNILSFLFGALLASVVLILLIEADIATGKIRICRTHDNKFYIQQFFLPSGWQTWSALDSGFNFKRYTIYDTEQEALKAFDYLNSNNIVEESDCGICRSIINSIIGD